MKVRVRKLQERRGWAFGFAVAIVKPALLATTTHEWIDGHKLPESGGFVLVLNHVSHLDPLTAAHLVYDHGRIPHYLAKSGLFRNRALGAFLRSAGQIPVERMSRGAAGAFDAAVTAVREGRCVVVYPEGTLTRDPDLWPMAGKSGAARIALETGCPVIPVGQWGAHEILYPYATRPDLFPRKRITMKVGDPVDLSDLLEQPLSAAAIQEATNRIMAAITALVEDVRGGHAPAVRFDPRKAGIRPTGNPHKKDKA
ncbi:1-acyl-sn-glycerol-3-phosphate acyltransferase [Nocardioides sp. cx-169]|uniref:lysophospholipid acyltransferase family protein n=1 Tax=Nocardioides sp. cx-169 TaxID=2899080 RepID=UPI001E56CF42|nr:lysophospholipid acyltransferase family protein [Nocardioides sp. cx-169]MCD4535974.1 1-acyl-sn-glycerol-3-phosphate acyltransferase [Nocardioides sp. cx-169]